MVLAFTLNKCYLDFCRVDVSPEEDMTKERKKLLRQHQDNLGMYMFDGTMLFTPTVYTGFNVSLNFLIPLRSRVKTIEAVFQPLTRACNTGCRSPIMSTLLTLSESAKL